MIQSCQHGGYVQDLCDGRADDVYVPIDLDCGELLKENVENLIGSMSSFDNKLGFYSCSELNQCCCDKFVPKKRAF